jgi:hypothetical protein
LPGDRQPNVSEFAAWRRLDRPGSDAALLRPYAGGWLLQGAAAFDHEAGPAAVAYQVEVRRSVGDQAGNSERFPGRQDPSTRDPPRSAGLALERRSRRRFGASSTTLALSFERSADLPAAVRTSVGWRARQGCDDGFSYGRQGRLRRPAGDCFFPRSRRRGEDGGGRRRRSWPSTRGDEDLAMSGLRSGRDRVLA